MIVSAPIVAAVGDSITYGYGLASPRTQSYPYVVGRKLHALRVVDLGVPGTDAAYAIAREVPKIPQDATVVLIFEGTNEMWPVIDPRQRDAGSPAFDVHAHTFERLIEAVRRRAPHAHVVLINQRNYGYNGQQFFKGESLTAEARFSLAWDAVVNGYAAEPSSAVVDLRCDPQMYDASLFTDGIHPTAQGHARIASDVEAAIAHPKVPPKSCAPFAPTIEEH